MTLRRATALVLLLLAGSSCHRKGAELGDVERLNAEPGNVGRYMVPYYASLYALPDGGAVVTWMKEEPPYRPVVYRQTSSTGTPLSPEAYLSPEDMRQTITIGLTLLPGAADGEFYAAWQARRPATGDKFVVFRASRDHGATWSEARTLNTQPTAFVPALVSDHGGGVYVAWPDERGYTTGIYFNRSLDRGETWLASDVRIDDGEGGGEMANAAAIASDGGTGVLVVWEEQDEEGRVVMAAASKDRGATWSTPTRVDDGKGRGAPLAPRAVFVGGRAVIAWTAAVGGIDTFAEVWTDASSDGGLTWGEDVLLHEQPGGTAPIMQLFSDGAQAAVVFEARMRGGKQSLYYVSLRPDGTWSPSRDDVLPVTPTDGKFTNPRLASDGRGTLYLVYAEAERTVRLMRSKDGGAHWDPSILVYERPQTTPSATVRFPQVAVGGGVAYILWEEWGDAKNIVKALGDAQNKRPPLDLFTRRIVFHD